MSAADEVIHPPRGYCIGIFQGPNAAMVGPYATEAEARDALAKAAITAVGMPEGWHQWCRAENGPLVCTRQQWPADPPPCDVCGATDHQYADSLDPEICRAHHDPRCKQCDEDDDDQWVHPRFLGDED